MKVLRGVMNGANGDELGGSDELDVEYAVEDDEGTRHNSCHSNHPAFLVSPAGTGHQMRQFATGCHARSKYGDPRSLLICGR